MIELGNLYLVVYLTCMEKMLVVNIIYKNVDQDLFQIY